MTHGHTSVPPRRHTAHAHRYTAAPLHATTSRIRDVFWCLVSGPANTCRRASSMKKLQKFKAHLVYRMHGSRSTARRSTTPTPCSRTPPSPSCAAPLPLPGSRGMARLVLLRRYTSKWRNSWIRDVFCYRIIPAPKCAGGPTPNHVSDPS